MNASLLLKNVHENLNAQECVWRPKCSFLSVYIQSVFVYPTCWSSKFCEFIFFFHRSRWKSKIQNIDIYVHFRHPLLFIEHYIYKNLGILQLFHPILLKWGKNKWLGNSTADKSSHYAFSLRLSNIFQEHLSFFKLGSHEKQYTSMIPSWIPSYHAFSLRLWKIY